MAWHLNFPPLQQLPTKCQQALPYEHDLHWFATAETLELVNVPEDAHIPAVVVLAARDIASGEELLLDYALSEPYPEWYSPVNEVGIRAHDLS